MTRTWADLNQGEFVGAEDLDGKDATMTITEIDSDWFVNEKGRRKKQPILSFKGTERKWIVNETNVQLMRAMWPNPDDAIGHKITLTTEAVQFGPKQVPGVRVKGSPELAETITVTIELPQKKPFTRKLVNTGRTTHE